MIVGRVFANHYPVPDRGLVFEKPCSRALKDFWGFQILVICPLCVFISASSVDIQKE